MNRLKIKNSKLKIILFLFVFCLAGAAVFYFSNNQEIQVQASPDWLSDYGFRKQISITGATGAGTDYQVKLRVGESSGVPAANRDFHIEDNDAAWPDDIRFTGCTAAGANCETNQLGYWLEGTSGSEPNRIATFWVKVEDDLDSNVDIYCYYGKSGASSDSNGAETFNFFDDFTSDPVSSYSKDGYNELEDTVVYGKAGYNSANKRIRTKTELISVNSTNWSGAVCQGAANQIDATNNYPDDSVYLNWFYNTDQGGSGTNAGIKLTTVASGNRTTTPVADLGVPESASYISELRIDSGTKAYADIWDMSGNSKFSQSTTSDVPTSLQYHSIVHFDYHSFGSCLPSAESLTHIGADNTLKSYSYGTHSVGCTGTYHIDMRHHWWFESKFVDPEPAFSSAGVEQPVPAVNNPPTITSVSDDSPKCGGQNITFTSVASDPDGDDIKLYICKDLSCSEYWTSSTSWWGSDPQATLTCLEGDPCNYSLDTNYYAKVCDTGGLCSFACGDPVTFGYKGEEVTYGTVYNVTTGECWMNRNLGAPQVATAYNDSAAYGDLFQWGRLDDGHQTRTSGTTTTLSSTDVPGHSKFITLPIDASPWDWRSPQNDNLWQGVDGINNPCPDGWRLPTCAEWQAELDSWDETADRREDAFNSPLKLTAGGARMYNLGEFINVNISGFYWGSSLYQYDPMFGCEMDFHVDSASWGGDHRADGLSARCIKDFPTPPPPQGSFTCKKAADVGCDCSVECPISPPDECPACCNGADPTTNGCCCDDGSGNRYCQTCPCPTSNNPPNQPTNPSPSDGASDIATNTSLSVDVSDSDGDTMDVSFYWDDDTLIETVAGVNSGSTATTNNLSLSEGTTYNWYAVADDGVDTTQSPTWNFTTTVPAASVEYGVYIDTDVSPAQFHGWAWGGNDYTDEAVIGWMSFNCINVKICSTTDQVCVTDSDCPGVETCEDPTETRNACLLFSDYKVLTSFGANEAPWADDLDILPIDYCNLNWSAIFSWEFNDNDLGDSQSAYKVQIATSTDFVTDLVKDSGIVSSTSDSYAPPVGTFDYGEISYYWRVKVWDNGTSPKESEWAVCDDTAIPSECFTTPSHEYPQPNFAWFPEEPSEGEVVQFCSTPEKVWDPEKGESGDWVIICPEDPTNEYKSICYDNGGVPRDCSDASGDLFSWTTPGTDCEVDPSDANSENPQINFLTTAGCNVTLEITDKDTNGPCSKTQWVGAVRPLPKWKEIPPF